jgi:hypothetical protein
MARKKAKFGAGTVQLPGFPPNVRHTQQAAQQAMQNAGVNSINQLPPVNWNPQVPQAQQEYQGVPSSVEDLQARMASLNLLPQNMPSPAQIPPANQPLQQGPLAGLAGNPQMMQGNMFGANIPQATPQNTQFTSQYLDPQRNQPADPTKWYHYLAGPFIGMAAPNTAAGRWWNDTLWGEPPKVEGANRFSPFQQNALNFLAQGGLRGLTQTPFNFAPMANQQLENFYTNTVPSLAERFTAMGGGQRSSAFQGALANAGRFLGNDLAAQQGQYNLQQQGNLLNLLNLGLTPQYEQFVNPGTTGVIPGGAKAATEIAKSYVKGGITG